MEERCKVCNSIINEVIIFNGETKHFCSISCAKAEELIALFRGFIQKKINEYQYISKQELLGFLCPEMGKRLINELLSEMVRRGYFKIKDGVVYQIDKEVYLPRK